jgi:superfamily I DNA/RNA helicase
VYAAWSRELVERNVVDFDDLIAMPVAKLTADASLRAAWQARFRYISIDEYQDIDPLQYQLLRLLVSDQQNLCAIGDPDQAIYGFRGADVGIFLRFTEDFPNARVIELGKNYRSQATIVTAALQAVAPSTLVADRRLTAVQPAAEPLLLHQAPTEAAEAEHVAHHIEQLVGGYSFFSVDSGRVGDGGHTAFAFGDIAVLYRNRTQLPALQEALSRAGIPYQCYGHERLALRPDVAAVVARLARAPKTDCVAKAIDAVVAGLLAEGVDHRAAVPLLAPLAERAGHDLRAFLHDVSCGAEADLWDPRADRVALLTLHAAKGLEFDVVFMVGCEEGLMPPAWSGHDAALEAEERRLFFVGMTRARARLCLSFAASRMLHGEKQAREPSRFLQPLGKNVLQRSLAQKRKNKPRQLALF